MRAGTSLIIAAVLWVTPAAAQTGSLPTEVKEAGGGARASLEQAKKNGDLRRVETALDALHKQNKAAAFEEAWSFVSSKEAVVRPIGSAFIARHADADELIASVNRLDARRCPDERRWLVRALGAKSGDATRLALESYLTDRDQLVRVAAAAALADLKDSAAEPALRKVLPSRPPVETGSWGDDERAALEMVASGAVLALQRAAAKLQPSDAPGSRPTTVDFRGQDAHPTDRFLLMFKAKDFSPMTAKGEMPWPKFSAMLDDAADHAVAAATPILGHVPMPPLRLLIADDRQFAGLAGIPTGFGGSSKGNEIVLRLSLPQAMAGVLRHEYVHAIHTSTFVDQPRWMSEGLAESLSKSSEKSAGSMAKIRARQLTEIIAEGAVSEAIAWNKGGVAGPKEGQMYALSHVVFDFLRFGPFSARDARLAALMGRLSRGEPGPKAVRELYGDLERLDQQLRDWLKSDREPARPKQKKE